MSKNWLSRSISKIADKLPYIGFLSAFLVINAVSIDGRVAKLYDETMAWAYLILKNGHYRAGRQCHDSFWDIKTEGMV